MPADAYIGDIMLFAGNFEPLNWMFCDGRQLAIVDYEALFQIMGTTYGGDGINNFCLPDLRGRLPVGAGTGAGLTPRALADKFGTESVALATGHVPSHNHLIQTSGGAATSPNPEQLMPAVTAGSLAYIPTVAGDLFNASAVSNAGAGAPHENVQPSAVVNYCICVIGVFPPQS